MAKKNPIQKKRQAVAKAKAEDKEKRQAGVTKELKNKKAKTKYYSHSKGI